MEGFNVNYLMSSQLAWNPNNSDFEDVVVYIGGGTAMLKDEEKYTKREGVKLTLENLNMDSQKLSLLEKILEIQT